MSDSSALPKSCPKCGADLPSEATEGLCPRCLMAEAMQPTGPKPPSGPWQPPSAEELQKLLPQYEITALLGRGGMGAVYKGRQISLDRPVAIKILSNDLETADASFAERFKNEARSMAKLSHPGIVAVFDSGQTADGLLYIVMEFIEGTDVAKMIAKQKRLHTEHAMAITAHVCDALAYAHERGIIHRDIKPANIMVSYDGVVKVADFGLAKMSTGGESVGFTQTGMAMGTLHYMAPEALMLGTAVDHRADIYAVGVMLYQMLTGKLPQGMFELPSLQVPGLDPRYDGIIAKALRDDRELRYQRASEMRYDLDHILTQPVVKVEPDATQAPAALPTAARPQRPAGQPYRPPQQQVVMKVQKKANPVLWLSLVCLSVLCVWLLKRDHAAQKAPLAEQPTTSSDASAAPPVKATEAGSTPAQADATAAPKAAMIAPNGSSSVVWNGRWKFTEKLPGEGWFASDFDDGQWQEGESPFGVAEPDESRAIPSRWDTPDLWLRRTFDLPPNVPLERVAIRLWYDSDGDVYLNGVLAFKFTGYNCRHSNIPLGEAAFKALRHGRNTIAIHGHNSGGGQLLDLTIQIDEFAKRPLLASEVTPEQLQTGLFVGRLQRTNADMFTGHFDVNHYPMWPNDMKKFDVRVLLAGKPCNYLFTHAPTGVLYELPPLARRFTATGIAATSTHSGINGRAWAYKVFIDRKMVFTSKPLNEYPNGEVSIDVPIPEGAKLLALTTDTLGSNFCDHAIWANPRLYAAAANAAPSLVAAPVLPPPQTWTDTKGRSITATFKAIANGNVLLEISGKVTPVAMNTLSAQSQKQARDLQPQAQPADTLGPVIHAPMIGGPTPLIGEMISGTYESLVEDHRGTPKGSVRIDGSNRCKLVYKLPTTPVKNLTAAVWVRFAKAETTSLSQVFSCWAARDDDALRVSVRNSSLAASVESGPPTKTTSKVIENGRWYHVAVVRTPELVALYVDGKEISRTTFIGQFQSKATQIGLGLNPAFVVQGTLGAEFLAGDLADFRVYERVLSESEIAALALPDKAASPTPLQAPAPTTPALALKAMAPAVNATQGKPFINTLGMQFVPVPGTKVLFCIHETRRQDYATFAAASSKVSSAWKNMQRNGIPVGHEDDHPVVGVSWNEAREFCAWLSAKDGITHRLPSDQEWSYAVGIGRDERRAGIAAPLELSDKIPGQYPWGNRWPPPRQAANLSDESLSAAGIKTNNGHIKGYKDGFATTAPVMSFSANTLGLFDLGGNVAEWCEDWVDAAKTKKVHRGCSWDNCEQGWLLSSHRTIPEFTPPPDKGGNYLGFRVVVEFP